LVGFEAGDVVYRMEDHSRYGQILSYEKDHLFANGIRQEAYRVRLHPAGTEAWMSARTARVALTRD
jgi:hypothetical protein